MCLIYLSVFVAVSAAWCVLYPKKVYFIFINDYSLTFYTLSNNPKYHGASQWTASTSAVLGMLIRDSRISYEKIASGLDVPEETAINRIFRMWDVGVISEYRIRVNPSLFGFKTAIVLAEAYRNYCKQKDVRALRTMDRVSVVVETTSKIYSAYVLYTDEQELKGLVDQIKAKISPSRVTNVVYPHEAQPSVKLSARTGASSST